MGSAYTILGRQVPAHVLSILTLGTVAGIAAWPRSSKESAPAAAPAPASNSKDDDFDLEKIISDFTKEDAK